MKLFLLFSCLLVSHVLAFEEASNGALTRNKRQGFHNFGGGFGGGFPGSGGHGQGHGRPPHGFNKIPNKCRGNKIRKPECQQYSRPVHTSQPGEVGSVGNGFGGDHGHHGHSHSFDQIPNYCRGNRIYRPECQEFARPVHSSQHGEVALNEAFNQISWLTSITSDNQSVVLPGLPNTPTDSAQQSRAYQLAASDVKDDPFQSCVTPRFEPGHCRYLRHCILPEFTSNFQVFLRYVCFIDGKFVGACCPDSRYPTITTTTLRPTTLPTTSLRPPTPANSRGCGINSFQQTKIVGGKDAELNKYPWAAALLKGEADTPTQYCGGVLISNQHVLTAAHCVDGFAANTITVRLGEYSFALGTESPHKDFKLAKLTMHENYDRTTYVNDIALLTLDRTTDLSKQIWPICLPSAGVSFVGEMATVIGWGTIYFGGPVSKVLQEVTLPVWSNEDCITAYKDNKVFPLNLCAGDKAGGKDSCQGDSGGPLMLQHGPEKRWTTIGVVSWGIRCADPGTPGVYARVSEFLPWIETNQI